MTVAEFKKEYFNEEQMAELLGISVGTLRNRISQGVNHPPYIGRGENRRFPIDAFRKWERDNLQSQVKRG